MMAAKIIILLPLVFFCVSPGSFADVDDFPVKFETLQWVAYAPTHFNPQKNIYPGGLSIEEDLKLLKRAGFNGIITYGSLGSLAYVPRIAKALGFKGVIMGVWDIKDFREIKNAVDSSSYVDGYCVGNEGLGQRYELEELESVIDAVKAKTGKPVTTTEQIGDYAKRYMLELGDWIFPNAHPFFCNIRSPKEAVRWVEKYYRIMKRSAPSGRPVLFKEIGFPTRGDRGCNENSQKDFFLLMELTDVKFAYFEAFDQYWKRHLAVEPYWGLFDRNRKPKKFVSKRLPRNK